MIPLEGFLPQGEIISALTDQIRQDRMSHALLISGETGMGKWTLAKAIAAALLCENRRGARLPCGECRSCGQMENLSHPDLIVLRKGEHLVQTDVNSVIPVADMEEVVRRVGQRGYQSDRHAVIIRHAEDMNDAAQNKLLKTLEEPPEGTFFLLTCIHQEKLLPTIISRCQPLKLHPWPERAVLHALAENGFSGEKAAEAAREAEGSFGLALEMAGDERYWEFRAEVFRDFLGCEKRSDIFAVGEKWKEKERRAEAEKMLSMLERFFSRLLRRTLRLEGEPENIPYCPARWKQFADRARMEDYVRIREAIGLARRRLESSVPFQAVTEQLIFTLMEAVDT